MYLKTARKLLLSVSHNSASSFLIKCKSPSQLTSLQCLTSCTPPNAPYLCLPPATRSHSRAPADLVLWLEHAGQSPPPSGPWQFLFPLLRSLSSTPSPSGSYMASFVLLHAVNQMSPSQVGFSNPLYKTATLPWSLAPTFPHLFTMFYCLATFPTPQHEFLVSFVSPMHLQNQAHSKHSYLSFETTT